MLWSFETFATLMAQITVAICSVILYVFLAAKLLPNWLLKPHVDPSLDGDRGIKRFVFDCGRAIVYEPSVAYRKYIRGEAIADTELAPTYLRLPQAERERLEREKQNK